MTDLDDWFRRTNDVASPDLWPEIESRMSAHPAERAGHHRIVTTLVAFALGVASVAVAVLALRGVDNSVPRQPGQTGLGETNGKIAVLRVTQQDRVGYGALQSIWAVDVDTGEERRLYQAPDTALLAGFSWSPDGTSVAFAQLDDHFGPTRLLVMSASGGQPSEILSCEGTSCIVSPAWSPDGTKIAFVSGSAIYTVSVDGSGRKVIAQCPTCLILQGRLAWSPDGGRIAFAASLSDRRGAIFRLTVSDGGLEQIAMCESRLCLGGGRDSNPSWRPSGEWIAFERERNIWLIRPDGSDLKQLTECPPSLHYNPCTFGSPIWAPDGSMIALQGTDGVYLMDADGGSPRYLVTGTLLGWQPTHGQSNPQTRK